MKTRPLSRIDIHFDVIVDEHNGTAEALEVRLKAVSKDKLRREKVKETTAALERFRKEIDNSNKENGMKEVFNELYKKARILSTEVRFAEITNFNKIINDLSKLISGEMLLEDLESPPTPDDASPKLQELEQNIYLVFALINFESERKVTAGEEKREDNPILQSLTSLLNDASPQAVDLTKKMVSSSHFNLEEFQSFRATMALMAEVRTQVRENPVRFMNAFKGGTVGSPEDLKANLPVQLPGFWFTAMKIGFIVLGVTALLLGFLGSVSTAGTSAVLGAKIAGSCFAAAGVGCAAYSEYKTTHFSKSMAEGAPLRENISAFFSVAKGKPNPKAAAKHAATQCQGFSSRLRA